MVFPSLNRYNLNGFCWIFKYGVCLDLVQLYSLCYYVGGHGAASLLLADEHFRLPLFLILKSDFFCLAYLQSNQVMGWGEKAIELRSVETGNLDGVFMHKKAQKLKFLCERNDKVHM